MTLKVGDTFRTVGGREVRVICTDRNPGDSYLYKDYTVIGLVTLPKSNPPREVTDYYTPYGKASTHERSKVVEPWEEKNTFRHGEFVEYKGKQFCINIASKPPNMDLKYYYMAEVTLIDTSNWETMPKSYCIYSRAPMFTVQSSGVKYLIEENMELI